MSNKNQRDLEKENLHLREQLAKVSFERDKYKKLFEVYRMEEILYCNRYQS